MRQPAQAETDGTGETGETAGSPAPRTGLRRALGHPLTHLLAALLVLGLVQGFLVKQFAVPSGSMEQTLEVGDRILVNRLAYGPPGSHGTPQNGDIVVFTANEALWPSQTPPSTGFTAQVKHTIKFVFGDLIGIGPTTGHTLVKRVIGTPGQTVTCCSPAGALTVDGVELDEPYLFEDPAFEPGSLDCASTPVSQRCFAPITVPEGMLLVLGDHRSASSDGIWQCRGSTDDANESCVRWVRTEDVTGKVFARIWPLGDFGGVS